MSALIAPEELLTDPSSVTVLDVRWWLGRSDGRDEYEAGHVPGAVHVDLETDLSDPPGDRGRHPLPDPDRFGSAMRRCGVSGSRGVVVYDDDGGGGAARAWWLLRYHGHRDARLLDGGWTEWRRLGGPVETHAVTAAYGDFEPVPGGLPVVDAVGAAEVGRHGVLVDVRVPERFRGEAEPIDPVAGRIPGAVNIPHALNVVADGPGAGRFRPVEELRSVNRPVLDARGEVAVYCGSGVSAAQEVLALELLGVRAALYPGSWSEWITDPERPVARG